MYVLGGKVIGPSSVNLSPTETCATQHKHSLKLPLKSPTRLQHPLNVSLQRKCCASRDR